MISHFLPFGEKFVENFRVGARGTVKQDDCAGMDTGGQLLHGLLMRRLFVLVPVYIGETPEKGVVAEFIRHSQIGLTVQSLRRAIEAAHFLTGDLFAELLQ